jgi:hypothetical protein
MLDRSNPLHAVFLADGGSRGNEIPIDLAHAFVESRTLLRCVRSDHEILRHGNSISASILRSTGRKVDDGGSRDPATLAVGRVGVMKNSSLIGKSIRAARYERIATLQSPPCRPNPRTGIMTSS